MYGLKKAQSYFKFSDLKLKENLLADFFLCLIHLVNVLFESAQELVLPFLVDQQWILGLHSVRLLSAESVE